MYMALFQPKAGLLLGAAVLLGLALLLPTAAQVVPPPAGPGVLAARQLRQSAPRALSSHCLVTFYRHLQPGMPKKLGKEHICAGCRAVVDIVIKKTGPPQRRKESKVVEELDGACDFENLRVYEFPPPTMQKACSEFLGEHEDAVETHMLKQGKMSDEELKNKICVDVTKVCKGIDLEAETMKQKGGGTVYMDNKKMNLDKDGKIVKPQDDDEL